MTFLTKSAAQFVGTWELVSIEVKRKNGDWALGRNHPVGLLMFDDVGNMAVQITTDPREVDNPGADSEFVRGCTSSAHLAPLALQSKRHFLLMVTPV